MEGNRTWKKFMELDYCNEDFAGPGRDYEKENPSSFEKFKLGEGKAWLHPKKELVDFAINWLEKNRE